MDMKTSSPSPGSTREGSGFLRSMPGRLVTASAGFAAATMGALALMGPTPHALTILATAPLVCIVGCVFAVGFALHENRSDEVIALILGLPVLAGVCLAGLHLASHAGTQAGAVGVAIGALLLVSSSIGRREVASKEGDVIAGHAAH